MQYLLSWDKVCAKKSIIFFSNLVSYHLMPCLVVNPQVVLVLIFINIYLTL